MPAKLLLLLSSARCQCRPTTPLNRVESWAEGSARFIQPDGQLRQAVQRSRRMP